MDPRTSRLLRTLSVSVPEVWRLWVRVEEEFRKRWERPSETQEKQQEKSYLEVRMKEPSKCGRVNEQLDYRGLGVDGECGCR